MTYSIENESPTIVRHFEQLRMKGPVISFSAIASSSPRFESVMVSRIIREKLMLLLVKLSEVDNYVKRTAHN